MCIYIYSLILRKKKLHHSITLMKRTTRRSYSYNTYVLYFEHLCGTLHKNIIKNPLYQTFIFQSYKTLECHPITSCRV